MNLMLMYHWEIFITIEIVSMVSLFLFGVFRYFFSKHRLSTFFIAIFFILLVTEAFLGLFVYLQTGEISTFLIVLMIFLIYACTFGIVDFIRLDRWMREKIGKLRGVELLTGKDYQMIARNKDPKYLAKKYRISSLVHLVLFVIAQSIFWSMGTESMAEAKYYATDFSWVEEGNAADSPYPNDVIFGVGMIWGIVFVVDFIYSWSYTLFPSRKK